VRDIYTPESCAVANICSKRPRF